METFHREQDQQFEEWIDNLQVVSAADALPAL